MNVSARVDKREFDRTFKSYLTWTSRDFATAVNTKAFFIARRAVIETPKADKAKVREEIMQASRDHAPAPLAAIIINSRLGKKGEDGLYGAAMRAKVNEMRSARARSIAFLKSGWLPAIKFLDRYAEKRGAPRQERGPAVVGKNKGGAAVARAGKKVVAAIWNAAAGEKNKRGDNKPGEALKRFGAPALQRAFDAEAQSMVEYIADKMYGRAKSLGIKAKR